MGLLSSLFGGGKPNEDQQAKQEKKNFEILKYDGITSFSVAPLKFITFLGLAMIEYSALRRRCG